jgi:aminopeptidase 2
LDIKKETSTITFNAADLILGDAFVSSPILKSQKAFKASAILDAETERASIKTPVPLPAGSKAQLQLSFDGKFTSNMTGYYKSSWERDGKNEFYSLTQFEVNHVMFHNFNELTG